MYSQMWNQWFAKNLYEIYPDKIEVTHEPILCDYYPRLNLWKFDSDLKPEENRVLDKHMDHIEKVTDDKIYVEIGWQSIAGISELYNRFSDRLKLIHLVRHPVNVAASLVTHNWYSSRAPERAEKAELEPFDEGARLTYYSDIWNALSEFEKCLYYWTEVNFCALSIKNRFTDLPFYHLSSSNKCNT
ncbi:MAG: hypothetical protein U5K69_01070 [Balneolaceae bacterium]|nr:hypothetical protein [Balneolaceae bacterium]